MAPTSEWHSTNLHSEAGWAPAASLRSSKSRKSTTSLSISDDALHARQSMREERARALEKDLGPAELGDLIEFSSAVYFCEEGEGHLSVEIVRLGACEGEASVEYVTEDGSAVAGRKYAADRGVVKFFSGERRKIVHIEILDDSFFDVALEFQLHLENVKGAKLGKYLRSCQVMILDDDTFPTNKFHQLLKQGMAAEIPYWPLLLEFFKMALTDRAICRAFFVSALCDQLANFQYVWGILLTNFLVDNVLKPPEDKEIPEDMSRTVWTIVGLLLIPEPVVYFLNRQKALRRIGGRVISLLQQNLLRKFLNYNEESRQLVSPSDLTMAITRDVPDLVEEGFKGVFAIMKQVGLLLICVSLQVHTLGTVFWFSMLLFFGCPILTSLFLLARLRTTCRLRDTAFQAQTDIVTFIQQTTSCFRLVIDYLQRPSMVKRFSQKVAENNNADLKYKIWHIASEHFTPYLTTIMCGAYVIISYQRVVDGGPIGEFIAGVALWKGIGHCYGSIFNSVRDLQQVLAPLQNIVHYMNLAVDTPQRMQRNRYLLHESRQRMELAISQKANTEISDPENERPHFVTDLLQVECHSVSFAYPSRNGVFHKVMDECAFVIPQAKLVCVAGPRGGGKATLLSMLGDAIRPLNDQGELFVPPHLRVLHISSEPEIFSDMDIFENLCFGPGAANDHSPKRVLAICRRLGMSREIIDLVDHFAQAHAFSSENSQIVRKTPSGERKTPPKKLPSAEHLGTAWSVAKRRGGELMANNASLLAYTDRVLIHLARAFIMNPDILVLHKPLSQLDDVQKRATMDLMREFVDQRGVEKPPQDRKHRCLRTCIYSVSDMRGTADIADMVLHVAQGKVAQVDVHELETLRKYARKLFEALDTDFDNLVTRDEFISAVRGAPWAMELLGVNVVETGEDDLGQMFDVLDRSSNGEVDFDELVQFLRLRFESNLPEVLEILHQLETGSESPHRHSRSCQHSQRKLLQRSSSCPSFRKVPSLQRGTSFGGCTRSHDSSPSPLRPKKTGATLRSAMTLLDSSRWEIPVVEKEMPIPLASQHSLLVEPQRCANHIRTESNPN